MIFLSTRGSAEPASLSSALSAGLAPDGGLYVPHELPRVDLDRFEEGWSLARVAQQLISPFFEEDALEAELASICTEAFDFDAPLRQGGRPIDFTLELFHGPTCAFKDFGARFLAAGLARVEPQRAGPLTILVATSGDTGAAVGAAFHRRPGVEVVILYPQGLVSPRQAHQLGSFGDNVRCFAVEGHFDDCQRMAKQVLGDSELRGRHRLTSANSISLGRLLPQMAYYAAAALEFRRRAGSREARLGFVIPTGNLGNAVACCWAKAMGMPIGRIALATNANRVLPDFLAGGEYAPVPSLATVANAMDVGHPSNFERLQWLHAAETDWRHHYPSASFSDEEIRREITRSDLETGASLCPHTATASLLREQLRAAGNDEALAIVATAHPAKFEAVVDPLLREPSRPPRELQQTLQRPSHSLPLAASRAALVEQLDSRAAETGIER